ncbi:MAG: response regulator transcription factor [Bdellovibrionales bacterium]|nr:response regulator transcription factor [Bdellovibrionales bacterium]
MTPAALTPKSRERVLVIEDEEDIAELLKVNLEGQGYSVKVASTGEAGIKAVQAEKPGLVLLDLMLPGMDGLEICRKLRAEESKGRIPIVMITAKGSEEDVVRGLEAGADDYVTKPFSPKVVLARVQAVLRRADQQPKPKEDGSVEIHELKIHPGRHLAIVGGERLDLTPSEFNLLLFLAKRPGWVFTRTQIVDAIRGENYAVTERSIDVQVVGLRKKLGKFDHYVETVRGVGYRFSE